MLPMLLGFCLINCTPAYDVAVNAFAAADPLTNRHFVVIPAMPNVSADDFMFQAVQAKIAKALTAEGFIQTPGTEADLAVMVTWQVETSTHDRVVSDPEYGWRPDGTGTATVTPGAGNTAHVEVHENRSLGVVGYSSRTVTETVSTAKLSLIATDLKVYRVNQTIKRLWAIDMVTKGGDLRAIAPVMLSVGQDYFGRSTGQAIQINVKETDPDLVALRAP